MYALPQQSWQVTLEIQSGSTAASLAQFAREQEPFCWIPDYMVVGYAVWGKEVSPDYVLQDGDRLELLRPLILDPMEARRKRAEGKL